MCSQMVSEKVGGAEGTKLDEDFKDLERVTCIHFLKISILKGRITTCSFVLLKEKLCH